MTLAVMRRHRPGAAAGLPAPASTVLPVGGADADDAVALARPYLRVRNDVLVPLLAVRRDGEQAIADWTDVGATPLPRTLTAQQAVTVGRAVGGALSSLHAHGLAHGGVDADAIVRDADGRPRLAGAGVAVWCGAPAAPADDVHALARVLQDLVAGDAGPDADAVRAALGPALASHPAARPVASRLVEALGAAAPPAPLPRPDPAVIRASAARDRGRPRTDHRRPAVSAGLAVLAVTSLAVVLAGHHPPTSGLRGSEPAPASRNADVGGWEAVVRGIAAARWDAFAGADAALLAAADAAGSPALAVDRSRVASFVSAHARVRGAAPIPEVVQVLHAGTGVAELVVREVVPAYDEVDDGGTVLAHRDASPAATWRITLVHTPSGWRTQDVRPS